MNWETAGSIAQIVEAFFVTISVIIIVYQQTRQTKLTKIANSQALFEIASAVNVQIMQDPELAKLFYDAHIHHNRLNEVEKYRFEHSLKWRLAFHRLIYYQHKSNVIDKGTYAAWEDDFQNFIIRRNLPEFWDNLKPFYDEKFCEHVDKMINQAKRRHNLQRNLMTKLDQHEDAHVRNS